MSQQSPMKFWMVLGSGPPTHRHETLESAKKEAERLASLYKGHRFVILESIAECCTPPAVEWFEHEEKDLDSVPF